MHSQHWTKCRPNYTAPSPKPEREQKAERHLVLSQMPTCHTERGRTENSKDKDSSGIDSSAPAGGPRKGRPSCRLHREIIRTASPPRSATPGAGTGYPHPRDT